MLYTILFYHLDYNRVFVDFSSNRMGSDVVVTTIDDVIAFEDDTIVLRHVTTTGIKEGLEQFGEFLRDFTTVTIIDNEGKFFLYIHGSYELSTHCVSWFQKQAYHLKVIHTLSEKVKSRMQEY